MFSEIISVVAARFQTVLSTPIAKCLRSFLYLLNLMTQQCLTLEVSKKRKLEGGRSIRPPPSTFDTIHPIDMKFGTYNKLYLYFQLSETTWYLIGFHGNDSQINDVTSGCHLGFLNFQILFKVILLYFKITRKQHLAIEIHKIVRIHCEVVNI